MTMDWFVRATAMLAASAALIHAVEAPGHFAEWWGFGGFFVSAAVAQALLAVLLIRWPRLSQGRRRAVIAAGIAGNLAIAGLYAMTRTVGIPLTGPEAGEVEEHTRSGLVSVLIEVVIAGALAVMYRSVATGDAPSADRNVQERETESPPFQRGTLGRTAGAALLAFVGIATIEALPPVIAAQEGGSGPGSALLLGQVVQLAFSMVGAGLSLISQARWPALSMPALLLALAVGSLTLNDHGEIA